MATRSGARVALALALAAAPATRASERVLAVELRSDVPLERPHEALGLVTVAPGDPLEPEAVARSLRNLNASGRAGRMEAWSESVPGGVRVIFAIWSRVLVEEVLFEGDLGMPEADLRTAVVQSPGHPLYEDRVFRSVYRLQDLYRERGYLEASVRVGVEVGVLEAATVTFRIASGEPAVIGSVAFDGDLGGVAPAELAAQLKGRPGTRYRESLARQDAERLEEWLLAQGHRSALVRAPAAVYHAELGRVDLAYPVEAGPHFTFEVVGADREALVEAGPLAPLMKERYDEALGFAAAAAVETHLQRQGHYQARVELAEERRDTERLVRLTVEPGPTFALASLELDGNEAYSDQFLRARMRTTPRRGLGGAGRLVDAWLDDDLANLRSFYALAGYGDAKVGPPLVAIEGNAIALRIPVREGPRRTVAAIELTGAAEVPGEVLTSGLPLAAGGPYHPNLVAATLDEVRARYEERGYNAARVDAEVSWSPDDARATVRLVAVEGPRSVVDRVIVRGYQRTDPELVRIAAGLEVGEPVHRRRLVAAERALYGLGIFSDVDVSLVPGTPEAAGRDVMIRVEEGRRRRFSYGAGFDSEDGLRGLLGLAYGNLFGRAIHARADLLASQRDQEVRLQVQQPYVWRRAVPLTYSLFGLEESRESYDSLRYAAQVGVERIRDGWRLGLVAAWERVELELLEPIEPLDIDRRLQDARIFSLTPSAFLDRRDDPVEPTSGWSTSALAEIAIPALGGEADFVKLFDQLSAYRGLGRLGVVAVTLRAGAIEPGNDGEPSAEPRIGETSELVPISERFFGGGSASHRAYELDTLGIVGETLLLCPSEGQVVVEPDGDVRPATCGDPLASDDPGRLLPVGGNGLLLASLDWRFPIVGDFGGTVFADAGNVWADWRDVDPREAKLGVGAGARYRTPVGPVRLDIAWKLDREPQEDPYQVFLSFGYAF